MFSFKGLWFVDVSLIIWDIRNMILNWGVVDKILINFVGCCGVESVIKVVFNELNKVGEINFKKFMSLYFFKLWEFFE